MYMNSRNDGVSAMEAGAAILAASADSSLRARVGECIQWSAQERKKRTSEYIEYLIALASADGMLDMNMGFKKYWRWLRRFIAEEPDCSRVAFSSPKKKGAVGAKALNLKIGDKKKDSQLQKTVSKKPAAAVKAKTQNHVVSKKARGSR